MRPLRIEFQAFGSFPGKHVVDFEPLAKRGLFVVTGPTGTGKTTVFDAMVYALYGVLPGGRSSDGDPRSHHAAPDVETFVTLDFEVDGSRYRVHRTPKWDRPKKSGTGTTAQQPTAVVSTLIGQGSDGSTEALATQATNTTKKCEQLVGLDAKQFQRVVLLPQGKFTDFLIATDENREQLLRQLFGGELFERATSLLKKQMLDLDDQVRDVDTAVQHHRTNAVDALITARTAWLTDIDDPSVDAAGSAITTLADDAVRDLIHELEPIRDERRQSLESLQRLATEATAALTAAQGMAKRYDDAALTTARLHELEAVRDSIAADEIASEASRRARPVVLASEKVRTAREAALAAADALGVVRAMVTDGFAALQRPQPAFDAASVAAAVQVVSKQLDDERQLLAAARGADAKATATEQSAVAATIQHDTLVSAEAELRSIVTSLQNRSAGLEPAAASVDKVTAAVSVARRALEARSRLDDTHALLKKSKATEATVKSAYEATMSRFVATQAPRLAELLSEGEPCPVCGALEHPAPARDDDGVVVDHESVDKAREKWSQESNTVIGQQTTIETLRDELSERADEPIDVFADALADAEASLAGADAAAHELAEVRLELAQRNDDLAAATEAAQEHGTETTALAARGATEREEADRLARVVAAIDAEALESNLNTVVALQKATADIAALFDAVTSASTELAGHDARLAEELSASGYADADAASAAVLEPAVEAGLTARVLTWGTDLVEATTRLQQLVEQGIPDVRPALDELKVAAEETNGRALVVADEFTTAANALRAAADELDAAAAVAADSADLRHRRDTARTVFKTCNGEAGIRVKLERWVLAGELDRVTNAANEHLARMTNRRYTLSRSTGAAGSAGGGTSSRGGLTLEVFDAHTGRSRPTASLSGGEQFQASLSLALGLADVVSHGGTASGKQFEALFVDEGFGSLDPNALDDAIVALSMLHDAGRMVGAITHVEAMKERLHVGIEVTALENGRGSTLTVNP